MKNNRFRNTTIELMLLIFISKIMGFIREIAISYKYGASSMSDAYSMANSIAVLIITGLATGIMTVFIPECISMKDERSKSKFTSNTLNTILIISIFVAVICFVFSKQIVSIIGMGFSEQTKDYTEILFRFVVISSICIFMIYIINGYLNTKKNFYFNGLQLIITNLIVTIAVFLSQNSPVKLGTGYLVAYIIPLFIGIYYMKRTDFSYSRHVDFADTKLQKMYLASIIAFLGTNVVKINVMLDRVFASSLQEGNVAAINYAFTLTAIVPEVFALSLATVMYPQLSDLFLKEDFEQFAKCVSKQIIQTIILMVPITIIFYIEGDWIVQVLFERGAFNEYATNLTLNVMQGYALGMLPMGINFILCRVFFARKEELIPTICLGASIIAKLVFNIMFPKLGNFELALSTSLAVAAASVVMFYIFIKRNKVFEGKNLIVTTIKSLIAGTVMIAFILVFKKLFVSFENDGTLLKFMLLAVTSTLSLLLYFIALYVMKVEEVHEGLEIIKDKLRKRG